MRKAAACFAIAILASITSGCSQSNKPYPNRPVHLVVGFGVGGPDTVARILATQLSDQMHERFLVDNKPGSSGVIAAEYVAKTKPDGYTLLIAPASLASLPSLQKSLNFDVRKSFRPISQIVQSEASFLVVPPTLPVHNLREFMAYARDPKNHASYASTGIGTGSHLRFALFSSANHVPMLHVPFKSPGEAAVSVMSGQTQALFLTTSQALPLIRSGKVRPLAYDFPTRANFLPDVPTMTEAGSAPTHLDSGWNALFAPAGTPDAIVKRLEAEVQKAIGAPDVQKRLKNLGVVPVGDTSDQFAKVFATTLTDMTNAAHAAGIKPQ